MHKQVGTYSRPVSSNVTVAGTNHLIHVDFHAIKGKTKLSQCENSDNSIPEKMKNKEMFS